MTNLNHENLYDFQKEIYNRFKDDNNAALLMDMGTGKTPTTISLIRYKYGMAGGVLPTVVFCPVITLENWKNELTTWTKLKPEYIGIVKGTPKKRLETIENPQHKIIIVNYEALRSEKVVEALKKRRFQIAVCDESQRIKSYKSISCRKVLQVTKTATTFKAILSGTPITNMVSDIWSQFLFLDGGATFGNRMSVFKARYMEQYIPHGETYPKWRLNPHKSEEFTGMLSTRAARITTEEAVDLPEMSINHVDVELSKEQKKHYDEVVKELITWLDDQEDNPLIVKNALTKMLRLNEISSGFMKLHDGTVHRFKTNPRLDACMELVEMARPHKIIIFCIFKENYKDLRRELEKRNIKYVEITGEVSTEEKLAAAAEFNSPDGEAEVCIANTRAAGLGVNLVGARYKFYYTRNFSLDDYLQSQKRNNRAGAIKFHKKLFDYHLIAPKTIDERIYKRIIQKKKFSEKLLDIKSMLT
jgi:SNF2 family DNA or RNA helicase